MNQMEQLLQEIVTRLATLEQKVDVLGGKIDKMNIQETSQKQKNALRRQVYREKLQAQKKGLITLPEHHCMLKRDRRLDISMYIKWGIEHGRTNTPYKFLSKVVAHWNTEVYLKKPVTFSGSSYRIWNGTCRIARGAGDLMHFYRKRLRMTGKYIRNPGEEYDFHRRPWFMWGSKVLWPVVEEMKEHDEWDSFDRHFKVAVQLLCGGKACLEVADEFWDLDHPADTLNKIIPRVSTIWHKVLETCLTALKITKNKS